MNFTFTVRRAYEWGSFENGKWNGMVGMLHEGKADIAAADLTVTIERSKAVDFLPTLLETTEGLYMRNPGDAFSLVSYFGPFSHASWICILLWVIIAPLLLVITVWLAANMERNNHSIVHCYIDVTTFLLNVRYMTIPDNHSSRIALSFNRMCCYWWYDIILSLGSRTNIVHVSKKN